MTSESLVLCGSTASESARASNVRNAIIVLWALATSSTPLLEVSLDTMKKCWRVYQSFIWRVSFARAIGLLSLDVVFCRCRSLTVDSATTITHATAFIHFSTRQPVPVLAASEEADRFLIHIHGSVSLWLFYNGLNNMKRFKYLCPQNVISIICVKFI